MPDIQQTVLRVQTNIPNDSVQYPDGELDLLTGSTVGFTYVGDGTITTPYSGSTSGFTEVYLDVVNRGGIVYYSINSGSSYNIIYQNGIVLTTTSAAVSGTISVSEGDQLIFEIQGTSRIINYIYFIPEVLTVYRYLDLDLYSDIPIKLNKSFAELQDISKRNSDYSIGISVPGSKKNNRFFEGYYNVDNDTLYFDPTKRVPCEITINDEVFFRGYLKLNKVALLDSKIEYDITLYSNIGDLFGKIGNNLLKDLNYEDFEYTFNHTFDKFAVQNWDVSPFSYDEPANYFYPVVHNGYVYTGDTVLVSGITSGTTRLYTSTLAGSYASPAAAYAAGVKRYRINSPEDGLVDNQLKPAMNISQVLKLLFKTYGYTIKSDFFNTPWFRLLYLYGYFSSDATKFSYKTPVPQVLPLAGIQVNIAETYVDSYVTCLGSPNIRVDRTYTITVVKAGTGIPCFCSEEINMVFDFAVFNCGISPGAPYSVPVTIPIRSTGTTYTWISSQPVDCGGGSCVIEYTQNYGLNVSASNVSESIIPLSYTPTAPNTTIVYEDGDFVDFGLVIDQNIKQIDLLSSIAKKFNLVFIPDPDVPNQIIIEPYQYYIGTGNIHDWTDKLSWDKGFTVEPALNFIESELIFTDLEDGDIGNKIFKDRNNRIYGQNFYYGPTDFKSQQKKIDTIFSPELIRKWDTIDTAPNGNISLPLGINYAASSAEKSVGNTSSVINTYTGIKTKPKIFYNLGNYSPFIDKYGEVLNYSGYTLTNGVYVTNSDTTSPRFIFTIPIVSHTMPIGNPDSNKINNDSICNLFNSELPTDVGVATYDVYTENDIYNLFYQNRITNIYDKDTRFLNGYFDLKINDIKNLKPNDLIKVNDQYFIMNKIDGYNYTNTELTKVELIQTNNVVSTYPTRYFKYFYCDNPAAIFKFETDMTNPSLSGTSYGWSILYDYNVGVLGGNVSGYTSTVRDFQVVSGNVESVYIPYTIYEVSETDYNTGGSGRTDDTLWEFISYSGNGDLNLFNYPSYVYTDSTPVKIIFNLFEDCLDFSSYASTYTILTGSSTYHGGTPPSPYTTGITLNISDTGWLKYTKSDSTTQYQYVGSLGSYVVPDCADCSTVNVGIPFADLATFTITSCGNSC